LQRCSDAAFVLSVPDTWPTGSTISRGSDNVEFAWMAGGGIDITMAEKVTASLVYRYIDLGKVCTDPGNIQIIRDGRDDVFVPVNETRVHLSTSEFMTGLRYGIQQRESSSHKLPFTGCPAQFCWLGSGP